ncbi:hypothetical protein ACMA1I_06825 [Pontibacter sp. 13R65]|uniref:hypothetical protein n=1 Tax=Pontibacter sp. 13R65 TaxID=3127458 RepID=UPI00301D170F
MQKILDPKSLQAPELTYCEARSYSGAIWARHREHKKGQALINTFLAPEGHFDLNNLTRQALSLALNYLNQNALPAPFLLYTEAGLTLYMPRQGRKQGISLIIQDQTITFTSTYKTTLHEVSESYNRGNR